jgi:hypothetical protein
MSDSPTTVNEKPALTPANKNPWYVLATIHGEQRIDRFNGDLAAKNRETWNRYYSEGLTEEQKSELLARGLKKGDLVQLDERAKAKLLNRFRKRIGDPDASLPELSHIVYFGRVKFNNPVDFCDFFFLANTYFEFATFSQWADFKSAIFLKDAYFSSATFSHGCYFFR